MDAGVAWCPPGLAGVTEPLRDLPLAGVLLPTGRPASGGRAQREAATGNRWSLNINRRGHGEGALLAISALPCQPQRHPLGFTAGGRGATATSRHDSRIERA